MSSFVLIIVFKPCLFHVLILHSFPSPALLLLLFFLLLLPLFFLPFLLLLFVLLFHLLFLFMSLPSSPSLLLSIPYLFLSWLLSGERGGCVKRGCCNFCLMFQLLFAWGWHTVLTNLGNKTKQGTGEDLLYCRLEILSFNLTCQSLGTTKTAKFNLPVTLTTKTTIQFRSFIIHLPF